MQQQEEAHADSTTTCSTHLAGSNTAGQAGQIAVLPAKVAETESSVHGTSARHASLKTPPCPLSPSLLPLGLPCSMTITST